MAKVVDLRTGSNAVLLKRKSENAKLALESSRPTRPQAIELSEVLASAWSAHLSDARLDGIADMLMHFPIEVGRECTDRWNGIAGTKIRDPNAKRHLRERLEPRRFPPSDPEIRDWCDERMAELWKLARAGEIAERSRHPPSDPEGEKPTPPKTAEDKAYVAAKAAEFIQRDRPRDRPPPLDPIYLARVGATKPIEKTQSEEAGRAFAALIAAGTLDAKPPPASAWWPLSNPDFVVDSGGSVVPRDRRYGAA
jgi:hypothetical protein